MEPLASTPPPPYYAVLFTSIRTSEDADGYAATAEKMVRLAAEQPGFLGVESVRDGDGVGITISYWDSLESVRRWGRHVEHLLAQQTGRKRFYECFRLRVCRVEEERVFEKAKGRNG
jgi:heme-degrading monooxygenase HmoA